MNQAATSAQARSRKIGVLLVVLGMFYCLYLAFHDGPIEPVAWLTSACLVALYLVFSLALDPLEPEPRWLIAWAVAWGAFLAAPISWFCNDLVAIHFTQEISFWAAPIIEELAKGAGLLFIVLMVKNEVDGIVDGILLGISVGLGFAFFEDGIFYSRAIRDGGMTALPTIVWARGAMGAIGSHAAYSALTGAGLAWVLTRPRNRFRHLMFPIGLIVAVSAHTVWNGLWRNFVGDSSALYMMLAQLPLAVLVLHGPFIVVLGGLLVTGRKRESRCVRQELSTVLTPEQMELIFKAEGTLPRLIQLLPARTASFFALPKNKKWRKAKRTLVEYALHCSRMRRSEEQPPPMSVLEQHAVAEIQRLATLSV
jgi:RsiW-degrading membrane proteinase PrsW (M82 family)